MNGGGLILAVLGLAGLGFAGLFLKRAFAAPEVPLLPEEKPPPVLPVPAPPVPVAEVRNLAVAYALEVE